MEQREKGIGERNDQMHGCIGLHWMCMMLFAVVEAEYEH